MDGASSSGPRPYIRLTSQLKNATRDAGGEVRLRCEAIGTQPIQFSWLKNHVPVEKSRKVKIRQRENSSRLVITELDVLDSGYYQCIATNAAASVNTTSILRVNNVPESALKSRKIGKPQQLEEYEDYELSDRGRLPDEEDSDLFRVPDSAGGVGYMPAGPSERWLDGIKYKVGDCVQYRGEACRQYLSGRMIMMTSESREDMYDIDRNLRAATMFIDSSPSISQQCRQISQAVACFHMYKVCNTTSSIPSKQPLAICKKDCDLIQKEICPSELALAAEHDLVGDGPKALFPSCPALPTSGSCIPIIDAQRSQMSTSSDTPRGHLTHWCYVNTGMKYEGAVSITESGKTCLDWSESKSREYNLDRYPELRNSKNFCRNPGGKKTRPWCFSQPLGQEEYCDVKQCPKEMYPHLAENPRDNSPSASDTISNMWDSMSSQWQLAIVGGGVFFFLLFVLFFCCACCCRTKKKNKGHHGNGHQNHHMSAPPSIVNSAGNSTYYRKLNGTSTPILARGGAGPMEMTSLLPGNQLGIPPPYCDPPFCAPPEIPVQEPYHILEIPSSQLKVCDLIGEGQFGMVHTGLWTGGLISGEPLQVAIKTCRPDATNAEKASLEEEVRTVASFDHPHVIRLLGVCYMDGGRLTAVFEYMVHGDLHDFLRLRAPSNYEEIGISGDNDDFMRIATQIAYGMEYLSSMNYVHRDLATRNCLVGDSRVIKIADFGLMRACYDNDYYKMLHRSWMPIRWMSKEALEQGRFSQASDVWSFGVTLWEIWSYGRQPYEGATNQQVIELIAGRHLLECPHGCPTNIYSLMVECWHEHPDRRPSFSEIHSRLQSWALASPSHSILHPQKNSNSSQSGSSLSGAGRGGLPQKPLASMTRAAYPQRGRRTEDASPLMGREANYAYSEDGDSY